MEWSPPTTDGGTPILGYSVSMKKTSDSTWLEVYDGRENPAARRLAVTQLNGAALERTGYQLLVRSYNWVGVSPDTQVTLTLIVTTSSEAGLSALTGPTVFLVDGGGAHTGIAVATAAIPVVVGLATKDATGTALTAGGSNCFIVIRDLCTVTNSYRCDPTPGATSILDGPVYQRMDDSADGLYSTTIGVKGPGKATIWGEMAKPGGFYGEYFNNAFLDGVPTLKRVDNYLDFDWGYGLITSEAADFVSVQWFGKIRAPATEEFTFVASADDGVRVYIDGVLLIDKWDICCDPASFSLNLTKDEFYDTVIEYKELQEKARFKFEWVSLSVPRELVPPQYVYYPERVEARVFELQVSPGPSISSLCSAEGAGLTVSTAGKLAQFTLQSRDWTGAAIPNANDNFAIDFVGPSEGGPNGAAVNGGSFSIGSTHVLNG